MDSGSDSSSTRDSPTTWKLVAAFSAIYCIWGSTYLAIRFAVETMPPLTMGGVRFTLAGGALYLFSVFRGEPRPTWKQWRSSAVVAALMLLGGGGAVCWAEVNVPSGITALLVAAVPFWMVLLNWVRFGRVRPTIREVIGVLIGFGGVALLLDPGSMHGDAPLDLVRAGAVLVGALSWAIGSLHSRYADLPKSQWFSPSMQMLAGGALMLLAGGLLGEWSRLDISGLRLRSVLALIYLITFGSIVAFSAYVWLLRASTPARVSTYAYVNPAMAVVLGWLLGGELLGSRTLVAMSIIVGAVVLITHKRRVR